MKKVSYDEAMRELREMVEALQNESIPIEELAQRLERAAKLVSLCRQKLRKTEETLDRLAEDLDTPPADE